MNRFTWAVIRFLSAALFAQLCLGDALALEAVPEWTVMIYINGNNDLEHAAECNFLQMLQMSKQENLKLLVELSFVGSDPLSSGGVLQPDCSSFRNSSPGQIRYWAGPRRFEISDHKLIGIEIPNAQDLRSRDALQEFLQWCFGKSKSHRYILVMWDHGDANPSPPLPFFQDSLFRFLNPAGFNSSAIPPISPLDFHRTHDSPLVGMYQENGEYFLSNQDIVASVTTSFARKLDVIAFDACYKAMLENLYPLQEAADIFAGSEASEPSEGWNYAEFLQRLGTNANATNEEVGGMIVQSFRQNYDSIRPAWSTQSAAKLSNLPDLIKSVDALAEELMKNSTRFTVVQAVRSHILDYQFNQIDLERFSSMLATESQSTDPPLALAAAELYNKLRNIIIRPPYAGIDSSRDYGSGGLAIYFPASQAEFDSDANREAYDLSKPSAIPFVQQHQSWMHFLTAYLKSNANIGP